LVAAAVMATVGAGIICVTVFYLGAYGMIACFLVNLAVRRIVKRRADRQEERLREEESQIYGMAVD